MVDNRLVQKAVTAFEVQAPRILVVDDEMAICSVLHKTLSRDQYAVEITTRPTEALRRLKAEPFDLLITDISMPEMDGLELAEQAHMAQASLGIVVMTAYGSYDNMARALRTGIADFITKPFDLNELRLTVGRALRRQQIQRDNVRLQTLVKIFDFSQAISSTLELEELSRVVSDIVIDGTGAIAVALWDADEDGQLRMQPAAWVPDQLVEQVTTLAQQAFQLGQPQNITVAPASEGESPVTLQALPLLVRDERIGVLSAVYNNDQNAVLHELLFIIATQTALAMRNARQYHALRELDRLKTEFIGIASHELRTPLSLVLGYSSLLRNRLDGRDNATLKHIIDGAIRIGDIVDDLVNLRRSDLQEHQLDIEQFDLWVVLREVVYELHPLAEARGVMLVLECPDAPTIVHADREKISLALAHLVDNATKFTRSSGVVRVVGQVSSPQSITIEVRDTGVGITPRELSRVFDRFYQVAPSATRAQTGMGIGLAIAKMFVELHGGQIQVQSVLGQGSVFQVRLPLVPAEQ